MKKTYWFTLILVCLFGVGCSSVVEITKVIWGSSTRALENARADAIVRVYDCSISDCMDAVLALARDAKDKKIVSKADDEDLEQPATEELSGNAFDIFIHNRVKQHIVLMGVKGNVDTTEVGIFFTQAGQGRVKLEISSLSSHHY